MRALGNVRPAEVTAVEDHPTLGVIVAVVEDDGSVWPRCRLVVPGGRAIVRPVVGGSVWVASPPGRRAHPVVLGSTSAGPQPGRVLLAGPTRAHTDGLVGQSNTINEQLRAFLTSIAELSDAADPTGAVRTAATNALGLLPPDPYPETSPGLVSSTLEIPSDAEG